MTQNKKTTGVVKPAVPATRAQRKRQRAMFLVFLFASGLALVVMGLYGWSVNFIPAYYLGASLIVFGVVGLCGVNIWKGGPYDVTLDPREPEPQARAGAGEEPSPGVWSPPPSEPAP